MRTKFTVTVKPFKEFSFISLSNTYQLPIPFSLILYKRMVEIVTFGAHHFSVGQFYDEQQDLIHNSFALVQEMDNKFGLNAFTSSSFELINPALEGKPDYVIHFFGPKQLDALDRILRFGGSGLLSVIQGFEEEPLDWTITVPNLGHCLSFICRSEEDREGIRKSIGSGYGIVFMENNSINTFVHPEEAESVLNLLTSLYSSGGIPLERNDRFLPDWS